MTNFDFFYRSQISASDLSKGWDILFSGFDISSRVQDVFSLVDAREKYWIVFPEYGFGDSEIPKSGTVIRPTGGRESVQIKDVLCAVGQARVRNSRIIVDITGILRPQLLFMFFAFKQLGVRSIDVVYTEPHRYSERDKTVFSSGSVSKTQQVQGYFGSGKVGRDRDLTIIAAGYDGKLLTRVAQHSENSEIVQLIGFPSLLPDMYQENMVQVAGSSDSFPDAPKENILFAPAADPFEAARTVRSYIENNKCLDRFDNIYISPLSTKAHTLGLGILHLLEYSDKNVSIIYPYTNSYAKQTSEGVSSMWLYTVEL